MQLVKLLNGDNGSGGGGGRGPGQGAAREGQIKHGGNKAEEPGPRTCLGPVSQHRLLTLNLG